MNRFLLMTVSAACGLGLGFAIRAWRQVPPSPGTSSDHATTFAPLPAPVSAYGKRTPLAEKTAAQLASATGVTRWLVWMTAVEEASLADLPHLATLATSLPGAVRILGARWLALSPSTLFDACSRNAGRETGFPTEELAEMLFDEWPKTDPRAAVAALDGEKVPPGWRRSALSPLFAADPELAVVAMSRWHVESFTPHMNGVAAWTKANPRHAAEVALANPAGYASHTLLEKIAHEWAGMDPAEALSFASGERSPSARMLEAQVLKAWTEREFDKASSWLASSPDEVRARLLPSFVEAWGKKDAPAALEWCRQHAGAGLEGDVVTALVGGAAKADLPGTARSVAGLAAGAAQNAAASALARKALDSGWFPRVWGSDGPKEATPKAIAWLGSLVPAARRAAIEAVQWSWGEADPKGFAHFLATQDDDSVSAQSFASAARGLARTEPLAAMALADSAPPDLRGAVLDASFTAWNDSQPAAAVKWLRELGADDPKKTPLVNSAVRDAFLSSAHVTPSEEQHELVRLMVHDPASAREALTSMKLPERLRERLSALLVEPKQRPHQ